MGLFNKKELERIKELEEIVKRLEMKNLELGTELEYSKKTINDIYKDIDEELNDKKNELEKLNNKTFEAHEREMKYYGEISIKKEIIQNLEDMIKEKEFLKQSLENEVKGLEKTYDDLLSNGKKIEMIAETGTYSFHYHYEDSQKFQKELEEIKDEQKRLVSWEMAVEHTTNWTINGSSRQGEIQMRNTDKLLLRAFNNECDNIIMNVKYSTINSCQEKIKKSYEQLNKFVKSHHCYITEEYLELKLKELELRCGYVTMKQKEKEEQQRIKEQMREEERVRKELEAEEKKVEKEEKHFMNELDKLQKRMKKENEETQALLLKQIEELQSKLSEISEVKADLMNRRLNNKAGYVYIISNVGSFGENVYKIGTTRRLDPQVRVDELSNASVPFKFDVHAMIFSDDAFDLENKLHQMFDNNRINKVNKHKEFFNVTLEEIEKAVKENFNETVLFNKTIINEEYLLSLSK